MKHYVAMAGLHGCLPNYVALHESRQNAIDDLVSLHELDNDAGKMRDLKQTGFVELNAHEDGNEYAEVMECNCDNPSIHDDAQEGCGGP